MTPGDSLPGVQKHLKIHSLFFRKENWRVFLFPYEILIVNSKS